MKDYIFRKYDIRGIYNQDFKAEDSEFIGYALSKFVDNDIVVATDIRSSSQDMKDFFIKGINSGGKKVFDLNLLPFGVAMFFAWKTKRTLAYLTASHLPKEWAGIKFFNSDGKGFSNEQNNEIKKISMEKHTGISEKNIVEIDSKSVIEDYIEYLVSKIPEPKKVKVALDFGNGMGSIIGRKLFEKAGFDVVEVNSELKEQSNRNPDPTEDDLLDLKSIEKDIGIAYDGDSDRMVLVDEKNKILSAEKSACFLMKELFKTHEGSIAANIECSMIIGDTVSNFDRKLYRQPVGHNYLVQNALDKNAILGIESSGHFIIPSLLPFDDAIAVSLYATSVLSNSGKKLSEISNEIKEYILDKKTYSVKEESKFEIMNEIKNKISKEYDIEDMDGIRINFENSWILIRPSNTSPLIRITMEAKDETSLERLKSIEKKIVDIINS